MRSVYALLLTETDHSDSNRPGVLHDGRADRLARTMDHPQKPTPRMSTFTMLAGRKTGYDGQIMGDA